MKTTTIGEIAIGTRFTCSCCDCEFIRGEAASPADNSSPIWAFCVNNPSKKKTFSCAAKAMVSDLCDIVALVEECCEGAI